MSAKENMNEKASSARETHSADSVQRMVRPSMFALEVAMGLLQLKMFLFKLGDEARDSRQPESEGRVALQRLVRRAVAFSIRQPWAWLIVNGYKDVENRSWWCGRRGKILIHAGKGMTVAEYEDALGFAHSINPAIPMPRYHDLQRGGIVGETEIVDCVTGSKSPWFVGEYGLVLKNQKTLPFAPCKGALGFFQVEHV